MLKAESSATDLSRRLFSNPRHHAIIGLIFVLLLATLVAHLWFASTPLPLGGPNVVLAAITVFLSLAYTLLCAIRLGKRALSALVEEFRPIIPIITVALLILIWALAVNLFTDTLNPILLAQMGMGIGVLFAVYLCVDSTRRAVLMVQVIILATFVSALFGLGVTFLGDPLFTLWRHLVTMDERNLAQIWGQASVAGLTPDRNAFGRQLTVAIPLAFVVLLYSPFRQVSKRIFALYVALMVMVSAMILNGVRATILGVLISAVIVVLLSMRRPWIWRRWILVVALIAIGQLIFFESLSIVANFAGGGNSPTIDSDSPTITGLATGFDSLTNGSDSLTVGRLIPSLVPRQAYTIQLRVQNAHGYAEREITAKANKSHVIVLTWREPGDWATIVSRQHRYRLRAAGETQWEQWRNFSPYLSNDGPSLGTLVNEKRGIGATKRVLRISDRSAQSRILLASAALRYSLDYPFGTGRYFPNRSHLSAGLDTGTANVLLAHTPHNQFLFILVYYGFPGLILLILFYVLVLRSSIYSGRFIARSQDETLYFLPTAVVGALSAYTVVSLFHNDGPFVTDWGHFFILGLVFGIQRIATYRNASSPHPTRVLLVSQLPPPPGGIETWTQILCERGLPAPFAFELVDTRAFRGHSAARPRLTLTEVRRNLRILWQIYRALSSGRFSLVHLNYSLTHTGMPRNLASAWIAKRAKVPYIAHLHGTFKVPLDDGIAARFYCWAYRTIFTGAAQILALGQPSYRAILELGDFAHKTCPLMPNFVDFRTIPERVLDQRDRLRVIFTGALIEAKGVHTIVEIAEHLPNARFQLVGDAPDESRANLLRHIRERGVADRVQVLGPVANREIVEMLSESDVFLFPSKFEGFPNSIAEAMAVGLPVVASSVGAIPEMIDVPDGGFLADSDDVMGYVEALTRLRDDPALRQRTGQYNRQKAQREYDYEVVIRQLCDIYSRVARARLG